MALTSSFETRVSPSYSAYAKNSAALSDSDIRIGTGNRIVRNGDDAASVSSALRLQTQTSTLRSTLVSGARATSFLQVAYDGLDKIRAILSGIADLTVQANAPGQTPLSYKTRQAQFQDSLREIDATVANTTFNGASILDGTASGSGAPYIQVGATSGDRVTLDVPDVSADALFSPTVNIGSKAAATAATTSVSNAQQLVAQAIAKVEAYQLRLDIASEATNQAIYGVNQGIQSLIGTDIPAEKNRADLLKLEQQTAAALLAQAYRVNSDLLGLVTRG